MRKVRVFMIAVAVAACGDAADTTDTTVTDSETTTTAVDEMTSTTAESTTTTAAPATTGSSLGSPIEVGSVVQVGDWRLRVSGVIPDAMDQVKAENEFNDPPAEGNQFFIASIEATYNGTDSSTFWSDMSLKAVGQSSVAYEGFEVSCGLIPDDINDAGETFPGGTISGNVCWSIQSTDADSLVMIAEEFFSFDDTREFLSLDPTAEPLDETTAVEASGVERGPTIAVGESATVGSWEITVVGVTPDATDQLTAENQFNDPPAAGNQFFIVALEATYIGTESSTFWFDMSLKAIGETNVAYEAFEATCGVVPEDINNAGETFPGGTISGNVCWSVGADDAASLVMIADESFTFDESRVFFALTE